MTHPEYRDGAYLFSPVSDNRPARFWPICVVLAPIFAAAVVHFFFRG